MPYEHLLASAALVPVSPVLMPSVFFPIFLVYRHIAPQKAKEQCNQPEAVDAASDYRGTLAAPVIASVMQIFPAESRATKPKAIGTQSMQAQEPCALAQLRHHLLAAQESKQKSHTLDAS